MSWNLRDGLAQLQWNGWTAQIKLDSPEPIFEVQPKSTDTATDAVKVRLSPREASLPAHSPALSLGDAYVRQQDLIAIYPEKSPWRFGYQIDLRTIDYHETTTLIVEFWLSVQTSLLDSHPKIAVAFDGFEMDQSQLTVVTDVTQRIGIMVHPLDRGDCKFVQSENSDHSLRLDAFGRFMEKGVIRRARFRAVFADRRWSELQWNEAFQEFSDSPLPLTT